jgi:hypothetical protein
VESASEGDMVYMFEADREDVRQNVERVKLRAGDSMLLPPSTVFSVYVSSVSVECVCRWCCGAVICVWVCACYNRLDRYSARDSVCAWFVTTQQQQQQQREAPQHGEEFKCVWCVRVCVRESGRVSVCTCVCVCVCA